MDLSRKDTPAEKADTMEVEVRQIVRCAAEQGKESPSPAMATP